MNTDDKNDDNTNQKISEPEAIYENKQRIRFSTIETQGDIQLEFSLSLIPAERIRLMYKLNGMVFKEKCDSNHLRKQRIIFSRYEYLAE